jgi:hypothetical protein
MFKKLTILMCLISFCPAAVGAQELTALQATPPAVERTVDQQNIREIDLSIPAARQAATVMAANDQQNSQMSASERPRKTHTGLTFQEFVDVHFGEYRWIYWAGAAVALVAIHVLAGD